MRLRVVRASIHLVAAIAFAACARSASAPDPAKLAPESLDPGDPVWEELWRLEVAGDLPAGLTAMRSATRGEAAAWVAAVDVRSVRDSHSLARARRLLARELRRLGAFSPEQETAPALLLRGGAWGDSLALDGVRSELRAGPSLAIQARAEDGGESDLGDSTRAGVYGTLAIGRSAVLTGEIFVGELEDGRRFGDPLIHGTDILYYSERVEAAFAAREIGARIARGRHHWGVGPGQSLLLDGRAAPLGFFEWSCDLPAGMRFRSWTGSLDAAEQLGIAAHRLEVPLMRDLRVSLSEAVRYEGGPDRLLYLLGLVPYTLVQRFDWQDAGEGADRERLRNNVLADLEIVWRPRVGHLTHAEILVDDLPAASSDAPARVAGRFGHAIHFTAGGQPCDVRIEGTKVGRYVYSVDYGDGCSCDWIHQDRSIGYPGGPDQERIDLEAGLSWNREHRMSLRGVWSNVGAGRLGEAWHGQETGDDLTSRALRVSGPVTRERGLGGVWSYQPRDNLAVEVEAIARWIKDPAAGGTYEPSARAEIRAWWRR